MKAKKTPDKQPEEVSCQSEPPHTHASSDSLAGLEITRVTNAGITTVDTLLSKGFETFTISVP